MRAFDARLGSLSTELYMKGPGPACCTWGLGEGQLKVQRASFRRNNLRQILGLGVVVCTYVDGSRLPEGWINLHLLLWKYTIYQLTLVCTEDARFRAHEVWQAAWSRLQKKRVGIVTRLR